MNRLIMLLASDFCQNLLTALLHSLWQGLVIAGLLLWFLRSKAAKDTNVRYVAGLVGLMAIVFCGLFTWSVLDYEPMPASETIAGNTPYQETVYVSDHLESSERGHLISAKTSESDSPSGALAELNWRGWAICIWLIGVIVMLLRAVYVAVGGSRLRRQCTALKDERISALVEQLRKSIGIARRIRVAVGEHILVPGVVGCIWPTLLLPLSMVSGVPMDDLRAILAHELAHIRRYDYLVNFCQMVIEAILFFNPAVWWISKQIRIEREACCDNAGIAATGQRIRYAEVLAGLAQRLKESHFTVAAPAIGFGKRDDSDSMLERVRRIVIAEHRPRLKVSWYIAAITLILSFAVLLGLWGTTTMTVALAGKLLTPQQRIDKITEIAKEYGFEDRQYGPEDNIRVSGVVRTFDDKPLPKNTQIMLKSERPRYGISKSISISREGPFSIQGTFNSPIEFGHVFVTASSDNYAPAFAGPFDAEPGGTIEGIELVLEQGFAGRLQVLDEDDKPVSGARLVGGYIYPQGGYHHSIKLTTDANGLAVIEHAAARKLGLQIEADGFEFERIEGLVPEPDQTLNIKLKSSPPTTGIVIGAENSNPIEGAEIRVMMSISDSSGSYGENGMYGEPDAVSGQDGGFTLTRLRSDRRYLVLVRAENYYRQYLSDVKAGDSNLKVELGPKKVIRGRITGDLGRLAKDKDGTPAVRYWQNYRLGNSSHSDAQKKAPVTIKDGIGYFEIDECWGQRVNIHAGDKQVSVNVDEDPPGEVLIELEHEEIGMREVVLTFNPPQDSPPVSGGVRIDYIRPGERGMKPEWLDIQDNKARYEVPVPCLFKYRIDYYKGKRPVGYWFEETEQMDIPPGKEPFVIDVPVHPAGSIYGRILRADSSLAEDAQASLIVAKKPEFLGNRLQNINAALHGGGMDKGKFNASPLPLGGEYAIVANSQNSFTATEAMTLDSKNPITEKDIQLVEGMTLKGRLLDKDGTPARNYLALDVSFKINDHSWGTTRQEIRPDEDGRFFFENVNPDFPGKYFVKVNVGPGYRPARKEVQNLNEPVVIQLEQGLRATGVIIDDVTGWPIPGVEVRAYTVEEIDGKVQSEFLEAEAPTNQRGEFVFSNMAERSYNVTFSGAQNADPRTSYQIIGGQKERVIIRAKIPDWSKLKPRKPID